jgi:predicted PurR-regulated permease PerM
VTSAPAGTAFPAGAHAIDAVPSPAPMPPETESQSKSLPPPWDRIFSLGTRMFVWGLLLAVLYILRPFLLLVFLTFVFAYVQAHGVEGLRNRIGSRPLRVTIVGLVFLGTILATVLALAPTIRDQANDLLKNHERYINNADCEINDWMRRSLPQVFEYLREKETGSGKSGSPPAPNGELPPRRPDAQEGPPQNGQPPPPGEPRLVKNFADSIFGLGGEGPPETALKKILDVGTSVLGYVSSFLLSLLFSFLIVLDLPKLDRGIRGLAATKVGFIYNEVADNISTFARVLGRALEAQLFIAVVNTILTALGMWILGISSLPVLSAIVFLCSFIPVAGVFISSTPICLLALQDPHGGFPMMLLAIGMILIVHAIETYILNPKIYGHHMRMNPVLVLIVLTIGGKLFGVWGLVLGIPIVNYFFRHAIRGARDQPDLAT